MSKGAGRIERAIRSLFDAHPDLAFTTDELIEHCFADAEAVERKHQVSVLRAAHKIVAADPNWTGWRIEQQGRGWVFLNQADVQSYALARLIVDGGSYNHLDSDELLAKLADDRHHKLIAPGGSWWLAVQAHCAQRDGNAALLAEVQAQQEAIMAALGGGDLKCFSNGNAQQQGNTYLADQLKALAARVRAAATQTDPDLQLTDLTDIAAALDALGQIG